MLDLSQQWGSDLSLGPTGDLVLASGTLWTQQRVLRRLLTNAGDYIWQLTYGAGLGTFIGQPANTPQISAVIRSQIFLEQAIARVPEPVIDVQLDPTGASIVYVSIIYVDAQDGQTQTLSFTVGSGSGTT